MMQSLFFHIIVAVADLSFRMASLHHTTFRFSSAVYRLPGYATVAIVTLIIQTYPTSKRLAYRPTYYLLLWSTTAVLVFPPVQARLRSPLPPVSSP